MTTDKTTAQTANVKKETATKNANEFLMSFIDKSLFVSNSGQNKETIYKSSLFDKCLTDRDKKSLRRKLRNTIDSFVSSFISYSEKKDTNKLTALYNSFAIYYSEVYANNDYTLNSLVSNNTDTSKKESIQKMLDIIAKIKK